MNYGYIICKGYLVDCIYMDKEYIEKIGATNFIMMQKFSERFKQIAENYNERTSIADIEQMLEEMIKLKKEEGIRLRKWQYNTKVVSVVYVAIIDI